MGQSFDDNDVMVKDTFPITSMDDIIEELKKPDVKYVKVFMHEGEPSIEKEITQSEALLRAVVGDLDDLATRAEKIVEKQGLNG